MEHLLEFRETARRFDLVQRVVIGLQFISRPCIGAVVLLLASYGQTIPFERATREFHGQCDEPYGLSMCKGLYSSIVTTGAGMGAAHVHGTPPGSDEGCPALRKCGRIQFVVLKFLRFNAGCKPSAPGCKSTRSIIPIRIRYMNYIAAKSTHGQWPEKQEVNSIWKQLASF